MILAVRNLRKGEDVAEVIRERNSGKVELVVMELDLSILESVKSFASAFKDRFEKLDILMNNAGIMLAPWEVSPDGFELHYVTNHLGPFLLTGLLIETLCKTENSRIVNVSSMGHKSASGIDYEIMVGKSKDRYSPLTAYVQTKLANLLFTLELNRRLECVNASTIAVAAHPGASKTNLGYSADSWWWNIAKRIVLPFAQSAEDGALPLLMAATDVEAKAGDYYGPRGLMESRGLPKKVKPAPVALNADEAKKLWKVSEDLVHYKYLK